MSFDCEITHIRNQVQIVELITLSVCEGEMKWTSSKEGKRFRLRLEDVAVAFQSENEGCKRSLNHSTHNKKIDSYRLISLISLTHSITQSLNHKNMTHSITRT